MAGRFAGAIEGVARLLVPNIVLLEVTRRVMQQRGEDMAPQVAAVMLQGRLVPLDGSLALSAAQLGVSQKLPLADSIICATARQFDATLWTMDADFAGRSGVQYIPKDG